MRKLVKSKKQKNILHYITKITVSANKIFCKPAWLVIMKSYKYYYNF